MWGGPCGRLLKPSCVGAKSGTRTPSGRRGAGPVCRRRQAAGTAPTAPTAPTARETRDAGRGRSAQGSETALRERLAGTCGRSRSARSRAGRSRTGRQAGDCSDGGVAPGRPPMAVSRRPGMSAGFPQFGQGIRAPRRVRCTTGTFVACPSSSWRSGRTGPGRAPAGRPAGQFRGAGRRRARACFDALSWGGPCTALAPLSGVPGAGHPGSREREESVRPRCSRRADGCARLQARSRHPSGGSPASTTGNRQGAEQ